jgi:hypothetical protein
MNVQTYILLQTYILTLYFNLYMIIGSNICTYDVYMTQLYISYILNIHIRKYHIFIYIIYIHKYN